ncbi:hypothetical protein [Syntrophotalea acetylenivorans]|uniref:hypothetical protein n=1 Tax=Syntrophotalea acetylenivorans TaxID=1842532 RepID=UPI0011AB655F|nr:hypothetical protein [Syntrophotalea acetylenivorans]
MAENSIDGGTNSPFYIVTTLFRTIFLLGHPVNYAIVSALKGQIFVEPGASKYSMENQGSFERFSYGYPERKPLMLSLYGPW